MTSSSRVPRRAPAKAAASAEPGPRRVRRSSRTELSRLQLLDAAEVLFGRRGFHDAGLREIAEAAEFSVGSVYTFFASKDDLINQIFVRRAAEIEQVIQSALAAEGDPPARLGELTEGMINFFRSHSDFGRIVLRYLQADVFIEGGSAQELITQNYAKSVALVAGLFREGQATGHFHEGDAESLARLWIGMVNSYHAIDAWVTDPDHAAESTGLSSAEYCALVHRAFCH